MATTDDLIIAIRADMGQLQNQLNSVNAQLLRTQQQGNGAGDAIKGMAVQFLSLGAAIEGLKKLVDVNREFGILKAGLETATGSAQGANDAFIALQDFAKTTPYDLAQATSAFTQLVNLGLTPSERALKSYGDTSAALGKDLSQMVEAVADAATGEFERLKEFGIKSKNQGDTIAFTFKGTTETVKNNAAAIEDILIKLGEVNFDGAMKKRMESLDGAIANLGDSFEGFFYQIGESGATESLNSGIRKLWQGLTYLTSLVKQIPLSNFKSAMDAAGDAVLLFAGYKITKMVAGLALATQETIKNIAAQSASRVETLANAEADAIAANMAARRAIVEKQLALDELNKARATTASALATQQSAIADLEAAQLQSRLALGTQQATVANLARAMAAEKVTAAQLEVAAAANAESAAIARATTASAANTAAATANATAQQALATATTNATIAGRTSGTMLTALGGPLGAVTTALGLAATAWFVFGDSAESNAERAINASKRIKQGLNDKPDDMRVQTDALMDVNEQIKKIETVLANWDSKTKGVRLLDKEIKLQDLKQQKAIIEENINNLKLTKVLEGFLSESKVDSLEGFGNKNTDSLSKFGVKKDQTPQVDDKKAEQEAKKLEQLKSAANAYLNQIAESNMSELQLEAKHFNEQLQQLEEYLQQKAITKSQYDAAVLDANSAFINKIYEQQLEQQAKEDELALKKQEREDKDRSRRMEQIQGIINEANLAGMTELERMDAQHAEKMEKIAQLAEGEEHY